MFDEANSAVAAAEQQRHHHGFRYVRKCASTQINEGKVVPLQIFGQAIRVVRIGLPPA